MLQIISSFKGETTTNSRYGDLNRFLREVLVEVAAENYRQTMYEMMEVTSYDNTDGRFDLDPPLRANERVMSGLFATAISRVASRSRSEVRIDRADREQNIDAITNESSTDALPGTNHGRADFLAWYADRVIAIELKMAGMNCESDTLPDEITKRWETALHQGRTAQDCLRARQREDARLYGAPISLALMVIVGRRSTTRANFLTLDDKLDVMKTISTKAVGSLSPQPEFKAIYTFPKEFRGVLQRKKGVPLLSNEKIMYTPFVYFIAKAAVNSTRG